MFDIRYGDTEITTVVIIFSVLVILPVQLLLCFKVKSLAVRLIPTVILTALTAYFIVMIYCSIGYDSVNYAVFAIFTGIMLTMSLIGWGIRLIAHILKKIRSKSNPDSAV